MEEALSTLPQTLLPKLEAVQNHGLQLPTLPRHEAILKARSHLRQSLRDQGSSDWAEHVLNDICPGLNAASLSPSYYGFVTGGCTPAALFGDVITSIYDQNVQVHLPDQTVATNVEACALGMLLDLFHLDRDGWSGHATFTTGATAGNILGLAMGREWTLRQKGLRKGLVAPSVAEEGLHEVMQAVGVTRVQVLSTLPHSSIAKAASVLGIGRANVISVSKVKADGTSCLEIDTDLLQSKASAPDVCTILAVSAGEVNTGHFATGGLEQMDELRFICDKHDIWMHVDGAFGLFGRMLLAEEDDSEFRHIMNGCRGLELADSIAGDAHKLLNVPYDCGFHFSRHRDLAPIVFQNGNAAYLASAESHDGFQSPLNIGLENSRRFRALPVYCSLTAYGREGYNDMLKQQIRLARRIAADLWEHEAYQVLPVGYTKAEALNRTFIVVLFRAKDANLNKRIVEKINTLRKMYVSGTAWDGKPAARIAIANWNVDVERDHEIVMAVLREVAKAKL